MAVAPPTHTTINNADSKKTKSQSTSIKAASSIATTVSDFTVLPLQTPALQFYPHQSAHYLYLRHNAPRVPTDSTARELFLANIPIDSTPLLFRSLFADQLGGARVESVEFEDAARSGTKGIITFPRGKKRKRSSGDGRDGVAEKEDGIAGVEVGQLPSVWDREIHVSGSTAVVRFVDRTSAELALREAKKAVKTAKTIIWPPTGKSTSNDEPPLGSARYLSHHRLRYPDPVALQASVDDFMAAFAAQEAEQAKLLAKQRSVPDEDGFITVTRGGRNAPAREATAQAKEEEFKKRDQNRVKEDFYRFQVREKRKEQAKDLVREFEQDRRKVEEMRKRRGKVRPE